MSSVAQADAEDARQWAQRLESIERVRSDQPTDAVRAAVARRVGVSPGTLENLRRGRIKEPRKSLLDKLKAALIRELEAELRHHEHELHLLKQTGEDPRSNTIAAVEKGLADIRALLGIER